MACCFLCNFGALKPFLKNALHNIALKKQATQFFKNNKQINSSSIAIISSPYTTYRMHRDRTNEKQCAVNIL